MAAAPTAPQPRPKAKRLSGAVSYLVWGSLAICAEVATSVLIALGIGASRGAFGLAQTTTVRPPPTVVQRPQAASEFEVGRLNDALRALSAERERLAARVDQLERSVGGITASVNSVKGSHARPCERSVRAPIAGGVYSSHHRRTQRKTLRPGGATGRDRANRAARFGSDRHTSYCRFGAGEAASRSSRHAAGPDHNATSARAKSG